MKTIRTFVAVTLIAATALLLGGCWTLSINPLYTEADLVYDPGLEGIWGDPEDPENETWEFKKSGEKSYRLIVREDEQHLLIDPAKDGLFEVHMLKLGDYTFLDLYPEEPEGVNALYTSHVIPAHSFTRMSLEGHVLTLTYFDSDWLKELADAGTLSLRHEQREGLVVLTAPTEEVQQFVLEHIDEAFEESSEVKRLQ